MPTTDFPEQWGWGYDQEQGSMLQKIPRISRIMFVIYMALLTCDCEELLELTGIKSGNSLRERDHKESVWK